MVHCPKNGKIGGDKSRVRPLLAEAEPSRDIIEVEVDPNE